jgi:hypothetical protein
MRSDGEAMADGMRQSPAHPTTTHAEWGAGNPRLRVTREDARFEHPLALELTRIGSAPDNELILEGAGPVHAVIRHDDRDEYVLTLHGPGEMNARPEHEDRTEILRQGAQFTIAGWTLVFMRDEYADHGRPFGGRQGGEFSDQIVQPERPDYTDEERSTP